MRKQLLSNSLWISFTKVITFLFSFGGSILLARILDPEVFGIVAMAAAISAIGTKFALIGIRPEVIKLDENDSNYVTKLNTILWLNIIITMIVAITLIIVVDFFGWLSGPATYIFPTIVSGWALDNCMLPARAILHKQQRYKEIFILRVFVPLTSFPIAIFMAFKGFDIWALVLPQAVALALSGWLAFFMAKMPLSFVFYKGTALSMLSHGKWYLVHSIMAGAYVNADKLLVGYFLGPHTLGLYHRALSLTRLFEQQLGTMLYTLGLPVFAGPQTGEQTKMKFLKYGLKFVCYLLCPAIVLFSIFSHDIVTFVYGEKWSTSAKYFDYLVPFTILWASYQLLKGKLIGSDDIKFVAKIDIVKLLVMTGVSLLLVGSLGVMGVGAGLAIGALVGNGLLVKKVVAQDATFFFREMAYPILFMFLLITIGLTLDKYTAISLIFLLLLFFSWIERKEISYVFKGRIT